MLLCKASSILSAVSIKDLHQQDPLHKTQSFMSNNPGLLYGKSLVAFSASLRREGFTV